MPAYKDNLAANKALVAGEVDWAGNFVPAIDRVFVERDPEHRDYWFPQIGTMVFLYANLSHPILGNTDVRRALSMAIDRGLIAKAALFDYGRPAHPTGLSHALRNWREDLTDDQENWVSLDIERANALLDEADYVRGDDGWRLDLNHQPLSFELAVISGWSDWVTAAEFIAAGMERIGIQVNTQRLSFEDWLHAVQHGSFELAVGWSNDGASPYDLYRGLMDPRALRPINEPAAHNWQRFKSDEVGALLERFESANTTSARRRLSGELQDAFWRHVPAIPLFANPSWGAFNTTRFEGFPSADKPYAELSPHAQPASLLVLTRLRPTSQSGEQSP